MNSKNPVCQDVWTSPCPRKPTNQRGKATEKRAARIIGRPEGLFFGLDGAKADDRRQRGATGKSWQALDSFLAYAVGDIRVAGGATSRLFAEHADAEFVKALNRMVRVGEDATASQYFRHLSCLVALNNFMGALRG